MIFTLAPIKIAGILAWVGSVAEASAASLLLPPPLAPSAAGPTFTIHERGGDGG